MIGDFLKEPTIVACTCGAGPCSGLPFGCVAKSPALKKLADEAMVNTLRSLGLQMKGMHMNARELLKGPIGCQAVDGSRTCSYPSCKCDVPLPKTMEVKAERQGETKTVELGEEELRRMNGDYLDRHAGATNERFRK